MQKYHYAIIKMLKKKCLNILSISFFCSLMLISRNSVAQSYYRQKADFAAINIGVNGLFGGVGALVNKKNGQPSHKVFLKGFAQGCLGGAISFLGKEMTYYIGAKNNLSYAWAARITNSIGNSISQNAISNRNFWEHWHFNLWFFRLEYDVPKQKFMTRLFPSSLIGAIYIGSQARLDLGNTLKSGMIIFKRDGNLSVGGSNALATALASSIGYNSNVQKSDFHKLMAHETIHILQYDNMVWANAMLNKVDARIKRRSKMYRNASRYIYFDLNGAVIYGVYYSQISKAWICRYLEREAEHFAKHIVLPECR